MKKRLLFETPTAVERLGEDVFQKCPLYRAKTAVRPIYINPILFKKYVHGTKLSWDKMSAYLSELFSVTIDESLSTQEQVGWAFVDKQADPLSLSLAGNAGSGRAYYTGKYFNLKGEKTPLATSPEVSHANGVLDMKDGIWNTLIANSLFPEIKSSPVLAILDLGETYVHPDTEREFHRVKIIRLDIDSALDRITHLFYLNKPLSQQALLSMAQCFGKLDAEKLMQRILHGSWSNGNISPQGHLIDYDSVCSVKGRQAQFSMSPNYPDNYFSFEYLAKLKVLESMVNYTASNIDNTPLSLLSEAMHAARDKEITLQLGELVGLDREALSEDCFNELSLLSETFKLLSKYMRFNQTRSYYANLPWHLFNHLFDFSNFFRFYPLLKMRGEFTVESAFALLVQSELIPETDEKALFAQDLDEPLEPRVWAHLEEYWVKDEQQAHSLMEKAINFIKAFDAFYVRWIEKSQYQIEAALHAYALNEDRFYLFPVFDLTGIVSKRALDEPALDTNRFIENIIMASRRSRKSQLDYQTDMRLFIEGISYIKLNAQGTFQIVYELHQQKFHITSEQWGITFNGETYPAIQKKINTTYFCLESPCIPIHALLVPDTRDETFKLRKYELLSDQGIVLLHDYYGMDPNLRYYL